jgi:hypothetical protein
MIRYPAIMTAILSMSSSVFLHGKDEVGLAEKAAKRAWENVPAEKQALWQQHRKTRFGTTIWGRNCTGQPHWLDGSRYPGLDGQSRLDRMLYVPLDPDGKPAATTSDPDKLKNGTYDCALLSYWHDQVRQMREGGLDWVAIDSFGDRHDHEDPTAAVDPRQSKYIIPSLVKAIRDTGVPLKICMFDDSPSHTLYHYRYELLREKYPGKEENGRAPWLKYRFDHKGEPVVPLPVNETFGRDYLAAKWIGDFEHMAEDQDLWLTHNGAAPVDGGHPIILMYGTNASWTDKQTYANFHIAFAVAKKTFAQRFGVEPFLILDMVYFKLDPDVAQVADGNWAWAPVAPKVVRPRKLTHTNLETGLECIFAMVMPGFELKNKVLRHTADRRRWMAIDGSEGDEKHLLTTEFNLVMADPRPDLVLVGHWNDFEEGQNFGRAIYPTKSGKGILPPDYYLDALRNLIENSQ